MNPIKMNQELLEEVNYLKNQNILLTKKNKELTKQLRISIVSSMLPSINSSTFKNYLEAKGYTETLNPLVYKKQGFEYDKEILHRHFLNEIEFGN